MKNFLRKLELPEFVRDSRLIIAFSSIVFLTVLSTVVAFFINRIFGVALLLVLIVDVFWVVSAFTFSRKIPTITRPTSPTGLNGGSRRP